MKIVKIAEDNRYMADVRVSVNGVDITRYDILPYQSTVTVSFDIEIEERGWGIKDITVTTSHSFNYLLGIEETDASGKIINSIEKSIPVDLGKIKKEEIKGKGVYTLGILELYLDPNFQVDYKNSSLEILKG